ncbi:MAG: fatty acid--CoA ligase family protein, partial [Ignavibacteria bacterium]|nr:fatty acid--CoA ligase family protein [Ignavibacteria bacterium]
MNKSFFINEILSHQSDKIACVNHLNQTLRYSELKQMVLDIEHFFVNHPLLKHKRYGFFTEDAFSLFPLVLGCLENIVLVPIDSQIPIEQFKEICEQYQLSGLISPNRTHPIYLEAENQKISLIHYELNQTIKLTLDSSYTNKNEIEKNLAFIINTTGTTDQAKRILIDTNAYMRQVLHEAQYYHFNSNIVHIISTKPSRYVSTFIGFRVLYAGGTLCISTSYQARVILEWIKHYRNINISMTPSGLLPLIEESKRQSYKHSSGLIQIFLSGSSVTQSLCDLFANHFNVRFIYNYGSSETGAISSTYFQPSLIPSSVGLLMIDHNSIRIENEEIQIKTNNLFLGYEGINRSEYMCEDWFKTGDSGYLDENNNLFIVGRIKEIINRGGDKISPFQIESKLSLNESILDCVVFPIINENGFDDIACAVVLKEGYSFDLKMCREYLRTWFIPY